MLGQNTTGDGSSLERGKLVWLVGCWEVGLSLGVINDLYQGMFTKENLMHERPEIIFIYLIASLRQSSVPVGAPQCIALHTTKSKILRA